MQGRKNIEPRLFYQVSLEQLVPEDHLVRQLAAVLDWDWADANHGVITAVSATAASQDDTGVVPELLETHQPFSRAPTTNGSRLRQPPEQTVRIDAKKPL
jgi:hypothetical protein